MIASASQTDEQRATKNGATKMTKLNKFSLETALADDRLWGNGYYGERANALDTSDREVQVSKAQITKADRLLIATANNLEFTFDELVYFINSKFGRWYAEEMIYGRVSETSEVNGRKLIREFQEYFVANRDEFI